MSRRNYIFISLFFLPILAVAQQNNTLFFMRDIPQVNIVNPATSIDCNWYLAIPVLGSTHVNQFSSGFSVSDLFTTGNDGRLHISPDHTINSFSKLEMLAAEVHVTLLTFGYKYKQHYFTFGLSEKGNTYNIFPKNSALFLLNGNSQFEGEDANMDGFRINGNHYREYALGWAVEVNKNFNLGIRAKILFGKGNAFMQPTQSNLYTNNNTFALEMTALADANVSFPLTINTNEDGKFSGATLNDNIDWLNYAMNTNNRGLGFDIGFVYNINESLTLSGSLLDLGFINWNTNPYNMTSSGRLNIDGVSDEFNTGDSESILDSIADFFTPFVFQETYKSTLTPTLYLGITKDINDVLNLGALFHSEIYKNRLHSSFTFSGNAVVGTKLSASTSYTIQNNQYNNVGFGLAYRIGIIHLHAMSDNIPAFFALDEARNINLRFGVSLLACPRGKSEGAISCVGDPYHSVHYSPKKRKRRKRK